MTTQATIETVPAATKKAHEKWLNRFALGFLHQAESLYHIKKDETFKAEGFTTFSEFCDARLPISRPYAYNLVTAHETLAKLPSQVARLITNESQVRPLAGMTVSNQAGVIKKAAVKSSGKITAKLIAEIAAAPPYNWKPKAQFKKDKKNDATSESEQLLGKVVIALEFLGDLGLTGQEAFDEFGRAENIGSFAGAWQMLVDWKDAGAASQ